MDRYRGAQAAVTLLYVEDDQITRETVCTLIGRRFPGLALHSAENGAAGWELFQKLQPDLVITDIKMPGMNGIEMARRILELRKSVPIIVTSAHSDLDDLIRSIEIGVSRYVMKPIDSEKLFAALEGGLGSVLLERELQSQQAHIRKLSRAVQQSSSSIVITDPQGVIEYVNPKFTAFTGYREDEVLGMNLRAFQESGEALWSTLAGGFHWHGELGGVKKSGEPYTEAISISPVFDEQQTLRNLVAVKEDITERRRAAREIELLNQSLSERARELEVANRDLESFSYTVSHDLRAPLTNINGYCQLIMELFGATLDEQCRSFVEVILAETVNMNGLIRTLLDFSRVSRAEVSRSQIDLSEIAVMVSASLRMSEPGRGLSFSIAPGLTADCDPDLMRVVLNNLLSNACKYSAQRGEALIEFGADDSGGERAFFVRDNGAGFDMAQADRLFTPFQRLHGNGDFKGFGIGLATVQRIVQRHGGTVWAEGEVGNGATFYFTLPAQGAA